MEVFSWNDVISKKNCFEDKRTGVSIGSFDGLHLGHRALLSSLVKNCDEKNLVPLAVTFSRPLPGIKHSEDYLGDVSTLSQRLSLFVEFGINHCVVIDFSSDFARIKGTDFLLLLKEFCNMDFLAEGVDFRCGYKGATDVGQIRLFARQNGIQADFLEPVFYDGSRVSSSLVRSVIKNGSFDKAAAMLSRSYALDCKDFYWKKENGVLTLQKDFVHQVLPQNGAYQVFARTPEIIRTRLEVGSETLQLPELSFNAIPRIQAIEFI